MGNGACCFVSHKVVINDLLSDEDFKNLHVISGNDQFHHARNPPVIGEVNSTKKRLKPYHLQNNSLKHNVSSKDPDYLSEVDEYFSLNNATDSEIGHFESEFGDSNNDTISALEESFVRSEDERGMNKVEVDRGSEENLKHPSNMSSNISLYSAKVQRTEVTGAGDAASNGVYRYFVTHDSFVMFTDQGQYQIRRGIHLSVYGEHFHDCWVIEERCNNAVSLLYAAASIEGDSIPSEGWICIDGASPAPIVISGNEECVCEEDAFSETDSDVSVYSIRASYLPQQ